MTNSREPWALIIEAGSEALYSNMNAADDERRARALETLAARFQERRAEGAHPHVRVVTHSLAFGSLVPLIADDPKVGSKVFAMTTEGSSRVVPSYGVVSSAKAALESHTRRIARELEKRGSGITVDTIRAGVTKTPALVKIRERDEIVDAALKGNPPGRMTTPQDVAAAIVALSGEGIGFINGEIIGVDGGEFVTGS